MTANATPQAGQRPGLILGLVSLPVFIGALDLTIVSAVLPAVIIDLRIPINTGANEAAWIVSGYLLAYTVAMLFFGRVSDLIGRRRTFLIVLLIFVLGSWLVAIASGAPARIAFDLTRMIKGGRPDRAFTTLYAVIFARVIQALGAGGMVPTSLALVADLYPPGKRATPLALIGGVDTAGWVLGHLYGGVMVQWVAWPVLFWLNIPITTAAIVLIWRALRPIAAQHREPGLGRIVAVAMFVILLILNLESLVEILAGFFSGVAALVSLSEPVNALNGNAPITLVLSAALLVVLGMVIRGARLPDRTTRPGWLGTALFGLALIGLNLALSAGGEIDPSRSLDDATAVLPPYAIPMLAGAALCLLVFVFTQRRSKDPLLNMANFRQRNFALSSSINLLIGFCLMVGLVSVPLFINTLVYPPPDVDRAALVSGYLLGGLTIPMALAALPGGWLTEKIGYRVPTVVGLALAATGFFMARTWTPTTGEWVIASHLIVAGIGLGISEAPVTTAVINTVQASERGVAAAFVLIMRLIGMAIGTSVMTSYGLRRWDFLNRQGIAAGETDIGTMAMNNFTQTINEMLIFAAVVCAVAVLPALFIYARDRLTKDTDGATVAEATTR